MEAALVGVLTAATAISGLLLWMLMVRPEVTLSLFHDPQRGDGLIERDPWFDHHPGALRALRWAMAAVIFGLAFLTGLALTFLSTTRG